MNRNSVVFCLLLGLFSITTGVFAAESAWLTDFAEAKKLAAERKVPILADFSRSDRCCWCRRLDREIFAEKAFQEYAKENLVLFMADFPRRKQQPEHLVSQNKLLKKKYKVRGYPTVLVLDSEGREVARTGYRRGGPAAYVKHIQGLLESRCLAK